ncbi:MAG: phage tail protein [Oscillospiraceae bacterium]|nr:phage tail protein [Oscillospiraceae bacterium]
MADKLNHPEYVTTGKPKVGGAVFRAPLGTELPTDALSALGAAFKCLGHCSDDGLKNKDAISSGSVKAWGGYTIHHYQDGKSDAFRFKLVEALNVEALKAVYGDENVTGDLATGIHIQSTGQEHEDCAWVVDMIHNGYAKRIVVPCAKVTEVAEIAYQDNAVVGYDTTISASPDENGVYHHEYIAKKA